MSAFTVPFNNEPGQLATLCEAMAARGVNLILCGIGHGESGTVALVADDEAAARSVLESTGTDFTERPALTVRLENVPGSGAATFSRLGSANVNVELVLPIRVSADEFFAVICADDLDAAKSALGDQVVAE
jgi:hypothetical protein